MNLKINFDEKSKETVINYREGGVGEMRRSHFCWSLPPCG
jgi:hypothetical protein